MGKPDIGFFCGLPCNRAVTWQTYEDFTGPKRKWRSPIHKSVDCPQRRIQNCWNTPRCTPCWPQSLLEREGGLLPAGRRFAREGYLPHQ